MVKNNKNKEDKQLTVPITTERHWELKQTTKHIFAYDQTPTKPFCVLLFPMRPYDKNMVWWTMCSHDLICYYQNGFIKYCVGLTNLLSWNDSTGRKKSSCNCNFERSSNSMVGFDTEDCSCLIYKVLILEANNRRYFLVVACLNWALKCASWELQHNS